MTATLPVQIPGPQHHVELISCQAACPVRTDARGYVRAIAAGQYEEAYLIARGPNPLASICGRICGAPCEAACRRGKVPRVDDDGNFVGLDEPVAIRALKRFVCERHGPETLGAARVRRGLESYVPRVAWGPEEMAALVQASIQGRFRPANGQSVAIVGAGPAGLAAAHDLALMGFRPVVYEMEPVPAGMLALGVPAYRLPRRVIESEVEVIRALGVEILCGIAVGRHVRFADLRRSHAAVIVACGAKSSRALGLAGERGPGVFGGVDLLRAVALGEPVAVGRDVVVIGGGNVAYDVARTVLRQIAYDAARTAARMPGTARVRLVALESLEEMPADTVEIREGDEEGIERPTVAGLLVFGKKPQDHLASAYIEAAVYRGTRLGSDDLVHSDRITGRADEQIDGATAFVARFMLKPSRKGVGREDFPQYDLGVVYEAIVNAVAHRDYSLGGAKIRLYLFSDRLELYSPGGLPNTLTIETMPYRVFTRNQLLVGFLSKMKSRHTGRAFLESRGEGVRRILEEGEAHSGRRPVYELFGEELRLTIWARPSPHGESD